MRTSRWFAASAFVLAATSVSAASIGSFSPYRLSEIDKTISADDFQGRGVNTPAETKTVNYIVDQFRSAGLQPGGDLVNGQRRWTQDVPLLQSDWTAAPQVTLNLGNGQSLPLTQGDQISLRAPMNGQTALNLSNVPLLFVGYGVSAPERNWDDFKGQDVKGKLIVVLVNDPDFEGGEGDFGGKAMTYYGRWTYKYEEAARRGAIAALVVHETDAAGYPWTVVKSPAGEAYNIVLAPGAQQPVVLQGWIQQGVAAALLKRAGYDYATVKRRARTAAFKPIDLKANFSADIPVTLARITSHNVLGKLTGSKYPNETVSFGGHWDAYGIGPADAQGRTIRPGAADDALGLAAMLEDARLFAAGPRPQRTLVFAAWTAEERGLLGSEYYAQHPLFPMETTVANLTFDTLQWNGPVKDAVLVGRGQSGDMERLLAEAANVQGRTVTDENHPERGLFYRADHFSFAKRGVPVLLDMALAGAYDMKNGGRPEGERWLSSFTSTCYHQTCDSWAPSWNLEGAAQEAELFYAIGNRLANSRDWPEWRASSEFKKVRDQSASARSGKPSRGERGH